MQWISDNIRADKSSCVQVRLSGVLGPLCACRYRNMKHNLLSEFSPAAPGSFISKGILLCPM